MTSRRPAVTDPQDQEVDRYQEIAVTPATIDDVLGPAEIDETDAATFIDELAELARAGGGEAQAIAEGSFALYPMPDGGMMFVTAVQEGLLQGIKHTRISPSLIRAVSVLAGGGSKRQALKAMLRKPRAIDAG